MSAEPSKLVRLGIVYADSLRLQIVTELHMREMGPKQFFDEIGGPSYDQVRKSFRTLADYGWLRKVRKRESGGPGRPEHVYRATELALIDEETWAEIPLSIRDAFTLQLIQQLSERIALGLKGGTLDASQNHVFSLANPVLDESGWKEMLSILSDCLASLEDEQTDAKIRIEKQGLSPILMVVALAGFESPRPGSPVPRDHLPFNDRALDTRAPWTIRLAKVFGDPINLQIVRELNVTHRSATELQTLIGGASPASFDRRCKTLAELGWVAPVDKDDAATSTRAIFYRATSPTAWPDETWACIPTALRKGDAWHTYKSFCELVFKAVAHGTINQRVDRHLTWCPLLVDEIGRKQVLAKLKRAEKDLSTAARQAGSRITAKIPPVSATYFLGAFESQQYTADEGWRELADLRQHAQTAPD